MSTIERYEILVLGSGEAGKCIAWTLAKAGSRAAVVERGLIGGSCPNIACLPSKNVIYNARVAALCRRGVEFGVGTGAVSIDMKGVRQRKRQMVDDLIAVHHKKLREQRRRADHRRRAVHRAKDDRSAYTRGRDPTSCW